MGPPSLETILLSRAVFMVPTFRLHGFAALGARSWLRLVASMLAPFIVACAPAATRMATNPSPGSGFRIVVPATGEETTMQAMLATLATRDVVFFGEQHDDPETHRAEAAVLDGIGRSGRPVVLSLEMFERDVQPSLDAYVAGRIDERTFLAASRPWPNYATDYRPLVEMAKARGWPVVASNVPRPLASAVGRRGLAVLDSLSPSGRLHAARDISCPADAYRARFMEQMRSHSPAPGSTTQPADSLPTAVAERFYLAQCIKDETMAESIIEARRRAGRTAIVVHVDGAFHSDFRQGTVERVLRRDGTLTTAIITAVPSRDPERAPHAPHVGRADFIIFTRQR